MLEAAAAALAALALYTYRADFERYSIFTAGAFRRLDRTVVRDEKECADANCEAMSAPVERRQWYKELVVAGAGVLKYGGGTHYYCEDHASFEVRDDFEDPPRPRTQRLALSGLDVVVDVLGAFETETEDRKESAFDDVQATTAASGFFFNIAGIALMILVVAVMMSVMNSLTRGLAAETEFDHE